VGACLRVGEDLFQGPPVAVGDGCEPVRRRALAAGGYDLIGGFWAAGKTPIPAQEALCNVDCNALPIDLFDVLREIDAVIGRIPMPLECPAT
jgi:hypothetical protein